MGLALFPTLPYDGGMKMNQRAEPQTPMQVARLPAVVDPCLMIAWTTYENARADGLCHDGAWECALAAGRGCTSAATLDDEQMRQTLWSLIHG